MLKTSITTTEPSKVAHPTDLASRISLGGNKHNDDDDDNNNNKSQSLDDFNSINSSDFDYYEEDNEDYVKGNIFFAVDNGDDNPEHLENTKQAQQNTKQPAAYDSGRKKNSKEYSIELDAALAKELNALSLKQRDDALYDIHGVANVIEETPELVQTSLEKLERYIEKKKKSRLATLLSRSKASSATNAYLLAESQSPDYVRRPSFRLHFLRSKAFNIKAAGNAIFLHFKVKQALFGDSKLSKNITQADLNNDDIECLTNGHVQLLPVCDPAGRHVLVSCLAHSKFKHPSNLAKLGWYLIMSILEMSRSETLAKGFVFIFYTVGTIQQFDMKISGSLRPVRMALPLRMASIHICKSLDSHDSSSTSRRNRRRNRNRRHRDATTTTSTTTNPSHGFFLMDWVLSFCAETALHVRTRIHRGNHQKCIEHLQNAFGIPSEVFPVTKDGMLRRDRHRGWLKSLKEMEEEKLVQQQQLSSSVTTDNNKGEKKNESIVFLTPSQSDVLLGRGKAAQTHIGNMRLRLIMEATIDQFDSLSERGDKIMFSIAIAKKVKSSGGHFLKFENGLWRTVSDEEVYKKISHDFRTLRTKRQQTTTGVMSMDNRNRGHPNDDDSSAGGVHHDVNDAIANKRPKSG